MELNAMTRLLRKQPISAWKIQAGVGLVEIMIALVIGLVLIAGASKIFLDGKQTYRLQDAQSRLQENARFALELLTNDIRMAGSAVAPTCPRLSPMSSPARLPSCSPPRPPRPATMPPHRPGIQRCRVRSAV
jgi:type IV pilus assembly protein PilW